MEWYNGEIMIIKSKPDRVILLRLMLKKGHFIKILVDIERKIIAAGGELHADEKRIVLEDGSRQRDLWGVNYYPNKKTIEYTSLINIRPSDKNTTIEIANPEIRDKVKNILLDYFDL